MKTIYLIRHPITLAKEGICYGQTDVDVAPDVMDKAVEKVQGKLKDFTPKKVYSSPLQRCHKLTTRLFGKDFQTDERLKEIDFGRWELTPWNEIPKEEMETWSKDFLTSDLNGGESYGDLQERFRAFWEELTQSKEDQIAIVTHSGIIKAFLADALEANVSRIFSIQVDYADVIKVVWHNEKYQEITFV